jgi:hypothetical protein
MDHLNEFLFNFIPQYLFSFIFYIKLNPHFFDVYLFFFFNYFFFNLSPSFLFHFISFLNLIFFLLITICFFFNYFLINYFFNFIPQYFVDWVFVFMIFFGLTFYKVGPDLIIRVTCFEDQPELTLVSKLNSIVFFWNWFFFSISSLNIELVGD